MATGSRDTSAIYEILYNPTYRPRASSTAHIETLTIDGEPSLVLMNESEGEYYDVDTKTNAVWQLLDGRRTVGEIFSEAKQKDDTLTEKEVKDTIVSLAEEGIIESTEPEVKRGRIDLVSAFQLDIHLIRDSSKTLAGLFRITRKMIRKEELPIAVGLGILGIALFYGSFLRIFADPSVFEVAGSTVLGFFFYELIVMLPIYGVHELAHAAACDYYGAKPREIGTGLYYLAPYFYCDTSDAWRLSRRARIMISVAGPLSTVTISSILVFASFFVTGFAQNVLKVAAFFGYYGSLLNFSPVIETDGYYILADVLNIPNLRDEAFSYIKRLFLRALRRPVRSVRQSGRRVRIVAFYSVISVIWLAYFAYTTLWLVFVYGRDAYTSFLNLSLALLRIRSLDFLAAGVNIATLVYFALFMAGFVVMGVVASKNIRMRGVRLETIHDKRASAFLPFPSSIERSGGSDLAAKAKKRAAGISRSYSVTLEPPLCVVSLKLGRVDQSLEDMRGDMRRIEQSFRSLHREFVLGHRGSDAFPAKASMSENLLRLASQFPPAERNRVTSSASRFLRRQDENLGYLLQSAFGTVWTLELSPSDYTRIKGKMFPSFIADDIGTTDLPLELEEFKKQRILGSDTIAQLSSEIEEESKEVYKRPEVYQATAYQEPLKSRLVFVGRTDKIEGSVLWLGGLYLYQAWASYIAAELNDAALRLRSIRISRSTPLTKVQIAGLRERELNLLAGNFGRMEDLAKRVEDSMSKIESTYQSAVNFHETLDSLVGDGTFDIGLYKPIMSTNAKHLEGVQDKFENFGSEFRKVSKRLAALGAEVREEKAKRASKPVSVRSKLRDLLERAVPLRLRSSRDRSPAYDAEVRQMFAISRLVYGVVLASDIVL